MAIVAMATLAMATLAMATPAMATCTTGTNGWMDHMPDLSNCARQGYIAQRETGTRRSYLA